MTAGVSGTCRRAPYPVRTGAKIQTPGVLGVARGGAAGPPGRADVSGGSGRQRTPIREEWWCQAGGPTLRRGGGPPATTRDATRGVRLSEIQRMQRDRQEEASAEECTLCTESDRSRLGQEPSSSIAEGWNNTVTWTVKMRIRNHWNNGRKSNHRATTALVCFKI